MSNGHEDEIQKMASKCEGKSKKQSPIFNSLEYMDKQLSELDSVITMLINHLEPVILKTKPVIEEKENPEPNGCELERKLIENNKILMSVIKRIRNIMNNLQI